MINIFILCAEVIIEQRFVDFIQNMVVNILFDFPHHPIIKHRDVPNV